MVKIIVKSQNVYKESSLPSEILEKVRTLNVNDEVIEELQETFKNLPSDLISGLKTQLDELSLPELQKALEYLSLLAASADRYKFIQLMSNKGSLSLIAQNGEDIKNYLSTLSYLPPSFVKRIKFQHNPKILELSNLFDLLKLFVEKQIEEVGIVVDIFSINQEIIDKVVNFKKLYPSLKIRIQGYIDYNILASKSKEEVKEGFLKIVELAKILGQDRLLFQQVLKGMNENTYEKAKQIIENVLKSIGKEAESCLLINGIKICSIGRILYKDDIISSRFFLNKKVGTGCQCCSPSQLLSLLVLPSGKVYIDFLSHINRGLCENCLSKFELGQIGKDVSLGILGRYGSILNKYLEQHIGDIINGKGYCFKNYYLF